MGSWSGKFNSKLSLKNHLTVRSNLCCDCLTSLLYVILSHFLFFQYFARDASYSCHPAYSNPDENGTQRIFLCRVAVGDWCKGKKGQLTPDPKPNSALELFDSTVDNVSNPSIFVVYHDAQAYPAYMVSFRRLDQ